MTGSSANVLLTASKSSGPITGSQDTVLVTTAHSAGARSRNDDGDPVDSRPARAPPKGEMEKARVGQCISMPFELHNTFRLIGGWPVGDDLGIGEGGENSPRSLCVLVLCHDCSLFVFG